jgi:hypothetical protein
MLKWGSQFLFVGPNNVRTIQKNKEDIFYICWMDVANTLSHCIWIELRTNIKQEFYNKNVRS